MIQCTKCGRINQLMMYEGLIRCKCGSTDSREVYEDDE